MDDFSKHSILEAKFIDILEAVKCSLSKRESERTTDADEKHLTVADVLSKFGHEVNTTNGTGNTLLSFALRKSYSVQVIEELLAHGASVTTRDRFKLSPLNYYFCYNDKPDIETVKSLLRYNADVNTKDQHLQTPLHYIVQHRNCRPEMVVKLLITCGADVTAEDEEYRTPLHYLLFNQEPDINTVRLLLDYNADVNAKDSFLLTPLHSLFYDWNCKPDIVELLLKHGADVTTKDYQNRTPLHNLFLSYKADIETVRLLLDYNADVNAKDKDHQTPLHCYLQQSDCKPDLVELLLRYGADVTAVDDKNETPLLKYIWKHEEPDIETVRLLLRNKADLKAEDECLNTLLHFVLKYRTCEPEVVHLLFKHGADVRAKDDENLSPIDCALSTRQIRNAKIAINYTLLNEYGGDWTKVIDIEKSLNNRCYAQIVAHINQCVYEIEVMKEHGVNDKFSLYEWYRFVNRRLAPKPLYTTETILEDEISNRYPVFGRTLWAVIKPCLDRADLFNQLELQSTDVCIKLGSDCLRKIAEYIPNTDLSNFISAFSL